MWKENFRLIVERWNLLLPQRQMWHSILFAGLNGTDEHLPQGPTSAAPQSQAGLSSAINNAFLQRWDDVLTLQESDTIDTSNTVSSPSSNSLHTP